MQKRHIFMSGRCPKWIFLFIYAGGVFLCSCESKTGSGAAIGAGVGVATGALITGGGIGGTLIGGALGAAGGAAIGSVLDAQDREAMQTQSPRTLKKIDNGEPLSVADVKAMSKAGVADNVIISQIESTHSVFYLTSQEIIDLKESEVSQRVIDYMIQTGT